MKDSETEQKNELRAKNEVAAKPETRVLLSNPEEDESEGVKESTIKQKNKIGGKIEDTGKPYTRLVMEFERDTEEDSDESVKAPPKKKTKRGVLHDSEDNNDVDGEDKSKITRRKRKSEAVQSNKRNKNCQRQGMV